MDVGRRALLVGVCFVVLCGSAAGNIASSYTTPQELFDQQQQTEVSPVQLDITIPVAAEHLVRLAGASSPEVWKDLLSQTPDNARRALLAQLQARRRRAEQSEQRPRQIWKQTHGTRRTWHQQRDRARGLAARLSSYPGVVVESSTRRAYSTLERDVDGRRRISSDPTPSDENQWHSADPHAPSGHHVTTDSQTHPAEARPDDDLASSYSSWEVAPSSVQITSRSDPSHSTHHPGEEDHHSGHPQVTTYRPAAYRVTTYRPETSEVIHRSGSPQVTTFRPESHEVSSYRPQSSEVSSYRPRGPEVTTYPPRGPEVAGYQPSGSQVLPQRRARAQVPTYGPARSSAIGDSSVRYGQPYRPTDVAQSQEYARHQQQHQERHQEQHQVTARRYEQEQEHQEQERQQGHDHYQEGLEWLRDVVPGVPGEDYPILAVIPETSFSCAGRPHGYYSDVATRCQVYHVCHGTFQKSSFICPNGTVFSQPLATCDWWFNTECSPDLPLPVSTFRVSRQTSRMFEDDWVDDYEDSDVTDSDQLTHTPSRQRSQPSRQKATDGGRRNHPVPTSPPGIRSGDGSASSGGRGVTWRSPFAGEPVAASSGEYRRPERHLQPNAAPPGREGSTAVAAEGRRSERHLHSSAAAPSGEGSTAGRDQRLERHLHSSTTPHSGERSSPAIQQEVDQRPEQRTRTFVATIRTPVEQHGETTTVVSAPFVVRVSYGGSSGRTTKELKFGPEAARSFLSRARLRGWSFPSGDSNASGGGTIARRVGVSAPTGDGTSEAVRVSRQVEEGDERSRLGSESRIITHSVLPPEATHRHQSPVEKSTELGWHRSPPTRPMIRPAERAEVAPPESSVEPPTEAETDRTDGRSERVQGAWNGDDQWRGDVTSRSTLPSLTQEESQREQAPSDGRSGGSGRLSYAELPTDVTSSTDGTNEIITDDVDFDYDSLLTSESFKNFGLKIPSASSSKANHLALR